MSDYTYTPTIQHSGEKETEYPAVKRKRNTG
jgi:hypothetical protein